MSVFWWVCFLCTRKTRSLVRIWAGTSSDVSCVVVTLTMTMLCAAPILATAAAIPVRMEYAVCACVADSAILLLLLCTAMSRALLRFLFGWCVLCAKFRSA